MSCAAWFTATTDREPAQVTRIACAGTYIFVVNKIAEAVAFAKSAAVTSAAKAAPIGGLLRCPKHTR
jgi:hypothetical protein